MIRICLYLVLTSAVLTIKVGIVHMHGLHEDAQVHAYFKEHVENATGLPVHLINTYTWWSSLYTSMEEQINGTLPIVKQIAAQYDKIVAVGFSQGGLVWRGMIEEWDNHNVDTFISLASPQAGVYGTPPLAERFIPFLDWVSKRDVYIFIYTDWLQTFSMMSYYRDPTHYQDYMEGCIFLPGLNNEVGNDTEKERKKRNFAALQHLVLIGGSGEDAIDPWQSAQFGFYTDQGFDGPVTKMENTTLYKDDLFGLKTLDERGAVELCRYDNISHVEFRDTPEMLDKCVLPALTRYNTSSTQL